MPSEVSALLRAWGHGDLQARDDLLPLVYQQLRRCAATYLRHERPNHTLQPTALVNEAYLRLVGQRRVTWQNRAHFFGVAAQVMRRILVDSARRRRAQKRPDTALRVAFDDRVGAMRSPGCEILLLEAALEELLVLDPRQGRIVELRYFGGLSEREIAELLSVSRSTVTREWQTARAWLYRRITKGHRGTGDDVRVEFFRRLSSRSAKCPIALYEPTSDDWGRSPCDDLSWFCCPACGAQPRFRRRLRRRRSPATRFRRRS